MQSKISFTSNKYATAFSVAFIFILPSLVWIALDKGLWRGDPCGYALGSVALYKELLTDLPMWPRYLFGGYKAPFILWIGQLFVAFGYFIGSVDFALLLIPLLSTFITLVLLFKSFESFFKNKLIALCGCLAVAASPLFSGLSTGFWIEPIQIAVISWFVFALTRADRWSFYFALSQFIIAGSLAMLIKFSSPLYIIGPSVAFWYIVFKNRPSYNISKKDLLYLSFAFLCFLPAAVFYLANFKALIAFAQFAGASPLFGSDIPKLTLWLEYVSNGVFQETTFGLFIFLSVLGIIKTIRVRAYSNFDIFFMVALFQITVFFIAWMRTTNGDSRYFLPAMPYFAFLIGWSITVINNRIVTALSAGIFLLHFIRVTGFTFGWNELSYSYVKIRPVIKEREKEMRIIHDIIPMVKRDSAIIFDVEPQFGPAEFQYEFAKKNLKANWLGACIDISAFFNYKNQDIDTSQINIDTVWQKLLVHHPDYYITWNSRMHPEQIETEMQMIDKYTAVTVWARWAIADKMKSCDSYELISNPSYPDLLVYKRRDVSLKRFTGNQWIQHGDKAH